MAYTKYSLTPANNNAAPPDGAPEGMLPSAVNDTMRDMMSQIRDCGDGIRGGTYTMTAPVITGGSISGTTMSSNVITGGSINNTPIGGTTRAAGSFTTVTTTNDSSISGLTIGKGSGAISTNTAIGNQAGYSNTTGAGCTFIGKDAGFASTTGSGNVFLGANSGLSNIASGGNTYLGESSGGLTTGNQNTFIGNSAGYSMTTGSKNTIIGTYQGTQGGLDIRTLSNYIILSDGDGNPRLSIPTGTARATLPNATGDVMVSGNIPAFSASQSSNQTIAHNTVTKLLLQTEQFDTNSCFTSSAFTPTIAGYYSITGQARVDFVAGRQIGISLAIFKNGSNYLGNETAFVAGTGSSFTSNIAAIVPMNGSTDTLELYIYFYDYTSGASYSTVASQTRLQGFLTRTL